MIIFVSKSKREMKPNQPRRPGQLPPFQWAPMGFWMEVEKLDLDFVMIGCYLAA